jgi:hypothetical protein
MRGIRWIAAGASLTCAACGGGGGGGSSNAPPSVAVTLPAAPVEVSRGVVVEVGYRCQDEDDVASTTLLLDRDGDLGTTADSIVLGSDLPETAGSTFVVEWDTTGIAPGAFTVFAVASDGHGVDRVAAGPALVTVRNVAFAHEWTSPAQSVASLPDGSCLVAGHFIETLTLGAGEPGETTLVAAGGAFGDVLQDVFVARIAPDGTLAWARRAGGIQGERCDAISAGADGSFVIAGLFRSDAVFGPGEPGETTLPFGGMNDAFVASYDAAGRLLWATPVRGSLQLAALARFEDGSCVAAGSFLGTATFGMGEEGETTLVAPGEPNDYEAFVARFTADGALAWARAFGGEGPDFAGQVAALSDGSCAVTSVIRGETTYGAGEPGQVTFESNPDAFDFSLVRFDEDGFVRSVVRAVGEDETSSSATCVREGPDGAILVSGAIVGTAVFGEGELGETRISAASAFGDSFVARYEADGSLGWVQRSVTGGGAASSAIPLADGGFVVGGILAGTTTIDPDGATQTLESDFPDVFAARFDETGTLLWARGSGRIDFSTTGVDFAAFPDGSFAVTGAFQGLAVFGAGDDHETALGPTPTSGPHHGFVARFNADGDF